MSLQIVTLPRMVTFVVSIVAIIIVLTLHTFAKAFVAVRCGDNTPKFYGRLSINPLRHFDYIGILCFAFAGFGWSKALPIQPVNFKNIKTGLILTSIAGILMNILTAFFIYPLYLVVIKFMPTNYFSELLKTFLYYLFIYSMTYAAFNLIPLPPLDAWQLIDCLAKRRGKIFQFFNRNGTIILYALLGYHLLVNTIAQYAPAYAIYLRYIDIFGYFQDFILQILSYPIQKLWGLAFTR